ncbi:MAG: AraC family transcriptional regulator [Chitinophagaceae bacterium]
MQPDFFEADGKQIAFQPVNKKMKSHLPGGRGQVAEKSNFHLRMEEFVHPLFSIGFRILHFLKSIRLTRKEKSDHLRLEAVLVGELPAVSEQGVQITLKAGEYHLTVHPEITALFKKNSACHYFVTHYSADFLRQNNISELVQPSGARLLTDKMLTLIHRVLDNPYQDQLRALHHDQCIREFMVLHLANQSNKLPGKLSDEVLKAILSADSLLQQDLTVHHGIPALAARVGTSATYLKRGFQVMFNMGVFERLTFHRLTQAKTLLETSNRTIDDIAVEVGYSGRQSFIAAFTRNNKMSPNEWRLQNK